MSDVHQPIETVPCDLVVHGAVMVATIDDDRREIAGGWVAIRDGKIDSLGPPGSEPPAAKRLDAGGCLVTPGLVNAHHHFWQNLTRAYAPVTNADFLGWLGGLYPLWANVDAEAIHLSTRVAMAELALSGCTTTSDHLYLQPPDQPSLVEAEILAARATGMRFTATRGSVDRGQRDGGPMPDHMLETVDGVLADCARLVDTYHDRSPASKTQVALGPQSVFGATSALMREVGALGEELDVRLHTHLYGDIADEAYCLDLHGCRPFDWFQSVGWCTDRAWIAHCLFPDESEIAKLGAAGVGVVQCITSTMLMGVGISPVVELRRAGCPVGMGVDGSANGDASSMWMEARMSMIGNRLRSGPTAFTARDALELATRGGAACLGRAGEIGVIAEGANADLALWSIDGLPFAGAVSDPIEAWLRCGPAAVHTVLVGGEELVRGGELHGVDIGDLVHRHGAVARRLQQC